MNSLNRKIFLITGADGFLGAALVGELLAQGARVYAMVRSTANLKRLKQQAADLSLVSADIADLNMGGIKDQMPNGIDVIIHAAAVGIHSGQDDWEQLMAVNVTGTKALLDLALLCKAKRFVYIGTSFEYGNGSLWKESDEIAPRNLYGLSKNLGWCTARYYMDCFGLPVIGLRPFYLYGPTEAETRLIPTLLRAMRDGGALPLTPGRQQLDFVYIDDAVRAVIMASLKENIMGELFNICTGHLTSVRQAVDALKKISGKTIDVQWGAQEYRPQAWMRLSGSPQKAKKQLGFEAMIGVSEGLTKILKSDFF